MSDTSPLFARGFRPFFAVASLFAVVAVPLWVASLTGGPTPRGLLTGAVWHGHEMLYGFTTAVIAGFLLTAVENWTGRPTLRGGALAALAALWIAARVALWFPGWLGPVLDLLFVPALMTGIARPLVAQKNYRNLVFLLPLGALLLSNIAIYADVAGWAPGVALRALRVAVVAVAVVIALVTARIVPMFTRNATGVRTVGNARWLDRLALLLSVGLLLAEVSSSQVAVSATSALAGGALFARSVPWWTGRVLGRPLLLVLHGGHAALALGLLLGGLPLLGVPIGTGPLHVATVGSIGLLTIGMMARVALGHTGRALRASRWMSLAFGLVALAALARGLGPWLVPRYMQQWWWLAALMWSLGFALYATRYLGILVRPRVDGRPG